ncbi:MAG TPA: hypothetical protein PLM75_01120 [bacterium]|nr:hypothetical protein [bacterium]HPP86446.1 hypothetical protein [bacterium]
MHTKKREKKYKYMFFNFILKLYHSSLRDIVILVVVLGGIVAFIYYKLLRP